MIERSIEFWYARKRLDSEYERLMKSEKYYELVRRYEQEAKQRPERFQRRTRRYLWMGYAYIGFILLLMVCLTVFAVFVFFKVLNLGALIFLLVMLIFTWSLIANLLEKIPLVEGIRLKREQVPLLFGAMDELREQMDIPDFDEVVFTSELNALAGEHRSRFFVGKKRRNLGLGMPLLEALNVSEFRTILAHEIAHLARGHSKLHAMGWHLRSVWWKLLANGGSFWWRWFAKIYGDRFEAMVAVLSREYEMEADRIASESSDPRNNISAHLKMELLSSAYDAEQAEWINAQVLESSVVPEKVISTYCQRLKQPVSPDRGRNHMRRILAAETSIYLTHPACRDRIGLDGFPVDRPLDEMVDLAMTYLEQPDGLDTQSASHHFLGSRREEVLRELDSEYAKANEEMWKYRTEYISKAKEELKAVEQRITQVGATGKKPDEVDLVTRASIFYEIFDPKSTCDAYEKVLEHYPDNATALFVTGQFAYMKEFDLAKAEDRFTRAVESDPRLEYDVSSYMVAVCRELEKQDEAERWQQHSFGALDALNDSYDERSSIRYKDKFISATLTKEQIDKIVDQISHIKNIRKVWVACKKLKVYAEKPLYVFGIETNDFLKFRSLEYYNTIGDEVANTINFGNQYFVVMIVGENKKFKRKFKKLKPPLCIDMADRLGNAK